VPLQRGFNAAGTTQAAWAWSPGQHHGAGGELPGSPALGTGIWIEDPTQAPGWKVLCAREGEIVTGTRENAAAGRCLMPVTDPKMVKNRLHLDLTSSAQGPGPSWPTPRETSSA